MNVEETESKIVVRFEDKTIRYGESRRQEASFLTSEGVMRIPEWKIDLINNHGVELNELQS